MIWSEFYYCRA